MNNKYGILIDRHNGCEIYQDGQDFNIVSNGKQIGKSNCLEGACVLASLGTSGIANLFKKGRR